MSRGLSGALRVRAGVLAVTVLGSVAVLPAPARAYQLHHWAFTNAPAIDVTDITAAPNGAWYTTVSGAILKFKPGAKRAYLYAIRGDRGGLPGSITVGPDGAVWFAYTVYSSTHPREYVGRLTTAGHMTTFPTSLLPDGPVPPDIAPGPGGTLWFTGAGAIGRITTSGTVASFAVPGLLPASIARGPDGALWFAGVIDSQTGRQTPIIGRITAAGTTIEHQLPADPSCRTLGGRSCGSVTAESIVSGPDGALWFTATGALGAPFIGRITTAGATRLFKQRSPAAPGDIAAGPDHALWFTDGETAAVGGYDLQIGRITTAGRERTTTIFDKYDAPDAPMAITAGPGNAIAFTKPGEQAIFEIGLAR